MTASILSMMHLEQAGITGLNLDTEFSLPRRSARLNLVGCNPFLLDSCFGEHRGLWKFGVPSFLDSRQKQQ